MVIKLDIDYFRGCSWLKNTVLLQIELCLSKLYLAVMLLVKTFSNRKVVSLEDIVSLSAFLPRSKFILS